MGSSTITNQEVISLGKVIISELGMGIECNTPARWLVHYIAENIHKSENSQGYEKEAAEKNCIDAIFKLWHHRSELPRAIKPFTDFDSVIRGLSKLDDSNQGPYYNQFSQFENKIDESESEESKKWVDIAISIDKTARILVSESFKLAANSALTEKSKNILALAPESSDSDIRVILDLLYDKEPFELKDEEPFELTDEELSELTDEEPFGSTVEESERIKETIELIEKLKTDCNAVIEKLNLDR
jgi:hypothetical protein